ncbi:MAG: bifunctional 5,10-methylenetetrahydrofolate dehydrogenase/5,10-methenyltetrahydrofolate cyclohydrolase [Parachlamydiaceae bacterium]
MIIDGKSIAKDIHLDIASQIAQITKRKPCLSVILVGSHPSSEIYVRKKTDACAEVGIQSRKIVLPDSISQYELIEQIDLLNKDPLVDGILVQLPLPSHVNASAILQAVSPEKDIDGFHPINIGKLIIGETDCFAPCTPLGIQTLLEKLNISVAGKHVAIIGRSNIVGKPMAAMLMQSTPQANATVTILHSQSQNFASICSTCDIVIIAIGRPLFLKKEMVKSGAIVIDVGINRIADPAKKSGYRIVGDADFEHLVNHCSYITPVPGGVGPMTIAMLLSNTLKSFKQRQTL